MNPFHLAHICTLLDKKLAIVTTKYPISTPDGNVNIGFVGVIAGCDEYSLYLHTGTERTFGIEIDNIAGVTHCLVPPPDAARLDRINVNSLQAEIDSLKAIEQSDQADVDQNNRVGIDIGAEKKRLKAMKERLAELNEVYANRELTQAEGEERAQLAESIATTEEWLAANT